jgi:hypothetical protein
VAEALVTITTRPTDREEAHSLLSKAQEVLKFLQHAEKLGYSIVVTPAQMKTMIEILESAHVARDRDKGFAAWPATQV